MVRRSTRRPDARAERLQDPAHVVDQSCPRRHQDVALPYLREVHPSGPFAVLDRVQQLRVEARHTCKLLRVEHAQRTHPESLFESSLKITRS